jgi:transcriptional regulator with XRE-family HTH domain
MGTMVAIGRRMRFARTALADVRVEDLAAALGVASMTVYRWEWGAHRASVETLERVADLLSVSRAWLITGHGAAREAA